MPDNFGIPKPIAITITGGVKGQPLTVSNRTSGDVLFITLGDTAKAVVDLQNFTNGYTAGDVIDFILSGERMGTATLTTTGDIAESVTLTSSAITTGLTRGI